MKQNEIAIPDKQISGLHINGLRGRVLKVPAQKKNYADTNILLVYGHHSSIERMYSLASYLSKYGNITMPDLPGFGGMDSFYTIGKKPTLDNMADYLATYIKLTYKKQPITICGMSYGFLVVTRMLQKYPYLQKQVTLLVSLVGFSNKSDFKFSKSTYNYLNLGSAVFSVAPVAFIIKNLFLTKPFIWTTYTIFADKHVKMKDATKEVRNRRIRFEVYLWKCNDARTYFATSHSFLNVDLTPWQVDLPLQHVGVRQDQYFDKKTVTKNLKKIYSKVTVYYASLPSHAPTVISDESAAGQMFPTKLEKLLKKSLKRKV